MNPTLAEIDDMLMIEPPPDWRMMPAACRVPFQQPRRWTSITSSNCSSVILRMVASRVMPALLTMMSREPKAVVAVDRSLPISEDDVTLQPAPIASALNEAAASLALASSRSPMTTFAPWSAKTRAISSPIPCAPPVITAVRPFSGFKDGFGLVGDPVRQGIVRGGDVHTRFEQQAQGVLPQCGHVTHRQVGVGESCRRQQCADSC